MKQLLLSITGLSILFSASPALAFDMITFDGASGNGSLYLRIFDGTIEPRVTENHTYLTPQGYKLDADGKNKNMRELGRYAQQFECRFGINPAMCLPAKEL